MIEVVIEEMDGSDWVSWPATITSGPGLVWQNLQRERNGALFGVHELVRSKSTWRERHCQRWGFFHQSTADARQLLSCSRPANGLYDVLTYDEQN